MAYLIGTDEAGYGPNLGPLVVSATLWRVPDDRQSVPLADQLQRIASPRPTGDGRLVIADSKQLYKPGQGLRALEANLLPLLRLTGPPLTSWRQAFRQLDPDSWDELREAPWYADYDERLPLDADPSESFDQAELAAGLRAAGVELCQVRSAVVSPGRFNHLVTSHGNKAAVLTRLTLQLVARLIEHAETDEPILGLCDKHGGRNKYAGELQAVFPEYLVEIHGESPGQSVYRWGPPSRRIELRFVAKGERYLQAALASMVSKYLRELAMRAFNRWWLRQVPGLKPTAGYPVDARRFRTDIQVACDRLGIEELVLWRSR